MTSRPGASVAAGLVVIIVVSLSRVAAAQGTPDRWPALLRQYEQQVAQTPGDPGARFTLSMLYARQGRLLESYAQLQEADKLLSAPQRPPQLRAVVREAESLILRDSRDLLARYRLAFARYFLGDHTAAVAEMERIVATEPRNDWAYGYLGAGYYYHLKGEDRGIATWERGLRVNPGNAVLHYLLGQAYSKKGDKKKAAAHFAAAYRDRTLYEYVTRGKR